MVEEKGPTCIMDRSAKYVYASTKMTDSKVQFNSGKHWWREILQWAVISIVTNLDYWAAVNGLGRWPES